jgi:hypothetical protein
MASTLQPVRLPLLQPSDGSVGVLRSAGSDVGKSAHHATEQQARAASVSPNRSARPWAIGTASLAGIDMFGSCIADFSSESVNI